MPTGATAATSCHRRRPGGARAGRPSRASRRPERHRPRSTAGARPSRGSELERGVLHAVVWERGRRGDGLGGLRQDRGRRGCSRAPAGGGAGRVTAPDRAPKRSSQRSSSSSGSSVTWFVRPGRLRRQPCSTTAGSSAPGGVVDPSRTGRAPDVASADAGSGAGSASSVASGAGSRGSSAGSWSPAPSRSALRARGRSIDGGSPLPLSPASGDPDADRDHARAKRRRRDARRWRCLRGVAIGRRVGATRPSGRAAGRSPSVATSASGAEGSGGDGASSEVASSGWSGAVAGCRSGPGTSVTAGPVATVAAIAGSGGVGGTTGGSGGGAGGGRMPARAGSAAGRGGATSGGSTSGALRRRGAGARAAAGGGGGGDGGAAASGTATRVPPRPPARVRPPGCAAGDRGHRWAARERRPREPARFLAASSSPETIRSSRALSSPRARHGPVRIGASPASATFTSVSARSRPIGSGEGRYAARRSSCSDTAPPVR
jgi:hypothetical protein